MTCRTGDRPDPCRTGRHMRQAAPGAGGAPLQPQRAASLYLGRELCTCAMEPIFLFRIRVTWSSQWGGWRAAGKGSPRWEPQLLGAPSVVQEGTEATWSQRPL